MMDSIAAASMSMSAAQLQQNYAISVQKMAMNTTEQVAESIQEMLPQQPPIDPSAHIDVRV